MRTFSQMFLHHPSTDVCRLLFQRCLLFTSYNWPRLQTNLQHVENWNRDRNRSHREKQTEIEIEARNWNRNGNRSWLKTETEIETEIDYWNRDRNRDRPRKTRPKWKSTSEPKRLLEVDFESGFWDLWFDALIVVKICLLNPFSFFRNRFTWLWVEIERFV